jgi:hypothetical protein
MASPVQSAWSELKKLKTPVKAEGEAPIFLRGVDLDERGQYNAHVEDENGQDIFSYSNETEVLDGEGEPTGETETGSLWLVEDGFMKNADDLDGLAKYLKQHQLMPENGRLLDKHEYESEMHRRSEGATPPLPVNGPAGDCKNYDDSRDACLDGTAMDPVKSGYAAVADAMDRGQKETALAEQLKDEAAVKAAAEATFGINRWTNYGDVNPAEHGGQWVKFDGDSFEIVETQLASEATSDYPGVGEGTDVEIVQRKNLSISDLSKDGAAVIGFCDAASEDDLGDSLVRLVTAWIPYFGSDSDDSISVSEENMEQDYAKILKRFGIQESGAEAALAKFPTLAEALSGGEAEAGVPEKDLIEAWVKAGGQLEKGKEGDQCWCSKRQLYSYNTIIAKFVKSPSSGNTVYVNSTKYSPTTSRLTQHLLNVAREHGLVSIIEKPEAFFKTAMPEKFPMGYKRTSSSAKNEVWDRLLIHDDESTAMGKPWVKLISGDPQGEAEREANRLYGPGNWSWKKDGNLFGGYIVSKDGDVIEVAGHNPVQGAIEVGQLQAGTEEKSTTCFCGSKDFGVNDVSGAHECKECGKEYNDEEFKSLQSNHHLDKSKWGNDSSTSQVRATGEPDQDYDKAFFDAVAAALSEAGFEATHREFDKYQGVYLDVLKDGQKIDRFWVKDSFQQGTEKLNPAHKYKSAVLIDADGEEISANAGDYFMMNPDEVFEGCQLLLTDMQGNETTIEEPKKSDLPDLSETKTNIEFEGEPDTVYVLIGEKMPPLEESGVMVVQHPDGTVNAGDLIEYLNAQTGAQVAPEAPANP